MVMTRPLITAVVACSVTLPLSAGEISFHPTIEVAREAEAAADASERQPIVLAFGAAWCGWCRKMEVDTFADESVEAMADRFLWVKVDADEQPELSARFRVSGLPHTFVLNEDDRIIASRPGYMPAEDFVAFLNEALLNPQPIQDLLYDLFQELAAEQTADERRETVTGIIEHIAHVERDGRDEALRALSETGPDVWSVLVDLLHDERLAVRAASAGTLQAVARADIAFDPFAPEEERLEQTEQWRTWIDQNHGPSGDLVPDDDSSEVGT
jgi:thioredoxin-related protein